MKVVKRVYVLLLIMAALVSGCSQTSKTSDNEMENLADEVNDKFLSDLILYQHGREISTWQSLKPDQEPEESAN